MLCVSFVLRKSVTISGTKNRNRYGFDCCRDSKDAVELVGAEGVEACIGGVGDCVSSCVIFSVVLTAVAFVGVVGGF